MFRANIKGIKTGLRCGGVDVVWGCGGVGVVFGLEGGGGEGVCVCVKTRQIDHNQGYYMIFFNRTPWRMVFPLKWWVVQAKD